MNTAQSWDLVVVGGGYAGLVAASRAAQLGRRALVLEKGKETLYSCNSRVAGGVLHISYQNLNDAPAALAEAVREITAGSADRALTEVLTQNSLRAVQWLESEGAKIDRSSKVNWRQFMLAPTRPPATGLQWEGFGSDMTLRLLEARLSERGSVLQRDSKVTALLMEGGRCVGVEYERAGRKESVRAAAVMLADGGFHANRELVGKYISPAANSIKQRCTLTGVGDGLRMAQAVGAATVGLEAFYGHLLAREAMHNDVLWPYPQIDELASGGILVDGEGRRFADEGHGGVYLANAVARLKDPLSATAVFDARIWEGPGRAAAIPANPRLQQEGGTLHQGATIAELAGKIGVPAATLEATITEFNAAVAAGRAASMPVPRAAKRYPPTAITQAPFYGIPICCGITFTMGGLAIDTTGRVLKSDRQPIPGLFAAGSTTGGLDGGPNCGYVGGLIKGIVFGMLIAEHLAGAKAV